MQHAPPAGKQSDGQHKTCIRGTYPSGRAARNMPGAAASHEATATLFAAETPLGLLGPENTEE